MSQENPVIYEKTAWQDVISFVTGQIKQPEFIQKYKTNVIKSGHYASVITRALTYDGSMYDKALAESVDMQLADFEPLKRAEASYIASKIVPALFATAYTRTPNNQVGGDGKPASYDRQRNIGSAAYFALSTLANIPENSAAMKYVYDEYFFPRTTPDNRKTGLLSNRSILDMISQDARLTDAQNVQMASKSKSM